MSIEPTVDAQQPGPKIGGLYTIVDQAPLDLVDRIALASAIWLGDLSDPILIHAACFDPRHALRLKGFEVAVCVHCGGINRWSITGESQGGIGPLGEPIWEWVRKRHHLRAPSR